MNLSRKVRMIVFDVGGTIIDPYVKSPAKVFSTLFERYNITLTNGMIRHSMGKYKKDHIKDILNNPCVIEQWKIHHRRYPTENDVEYLYKNFQPIQYQTIEKYAFEIPNTINILTQLKQKYVISYGISTGFSRKMLDLVLKQNPEISKLIDSSSTSDEVSLPRPFSDMVKENMLKQNITNSNLVVKVDDTNVGIEEGKNANTWTVGIVKYGNEMGNYVDSIEEFQKLPYEHQQKLMLSSIESFQKSQPHFIIDSIENMPEVIDEINNYLQSGFKPENFKTTLIISKYLKR